VINEFRLFLETQKAQFTPEDFAANRDWVKKELKREMYITAFSQDESQRVAIEQDPVVLRAIDSMPKAKALVDNAKKLLVQRIGAPQVAAK
jgi:carboxyl-terminal processing protease